MKKLMILSAAALGSSEASAANSELTESAAARILVMLTHTPDAGMPLLLPRSGLRLRAPPQKC